jgi:hypothetical protein
MMPVFLLLGALAGATQVPARASTINPALQSITPGVVGGDPGFSGTVGYNFSLTVPYTVNYLGFYDDLNDGLLSSHMVGIFDATTQALLVSATLPSGTGSVLQNGFRWESVAEVVLAPGSYVMGATTSGVPTSFDPMLYSGTDPVVSNGFVLGTSSLDESGSGTVVAFPTIDEGVPYGFFGPNMAGSVPEIDPNSIGSVLALVLGSLGLLERRRLKAA